MLRTAAERWLRKRFTFPALVLAAAGLLVVSEYTYVQTSTSLRGGIGWTEARSAVSRLMQLVTDAESASLRYLLSGHAEDLHPYDVAKAELPSARDAVTEFLNRAGPEGQATAKRLTVVADDFLAESDQAVGLAQEGQRDAAIALVQTGHGREKMLALRSELNEQLTRTGRSQRASRVTLFDALQFNRIGVGALAALSVFGLFVFMRQLQLQDQERNQQQAELARERTRLEGEVRRRTADLRELANHLQTAREDERAHLARELHDELGGLLTAIKLDIARLRTKLENQPDLKARLEHLNKNLNDGIAFKRRVIEDLRPSALANLGLKVSLETLCSDMSTRLDVPVEAQLMDLRLGPQADLAVYRFVQEALTNIGKYAEATRVVVSLLPFGERAVVEVRDDGLGFDSTLARPGHHGLTGMRFRAESLGGRMTIESAPGQGTTLRAEFPRALLATTPTPSPTDEPPERLAAAQPDPQQAA